MNSKLSFSIPPSKDPSEGAAAGWLSLPIASSRVRARPRPGGDGIWNGMEKLFVMEFDSSIKRRPIKRMKKLELPAEATCFVLPTAGEERIIYAREKSWRYDILLNLVDDNKLGFRVSGCTLPQDMEEVILLQLPVRSLLRFKAVSKEFRSLISTPRFISHHMSKVQQLSIVRCFLKKRWLLLRNSPHTAHAPVLEAFDHHIGGLPVEDNFFLVGSANGLVCLHPHVWLPDSENRPYVLWNPATRQFRNIPRHSIKLMILTFGYRSGIHEDYILFGFSNASNAIHVFSLRQGSWRTINCSMDTRQWIALLDSSLRVVLNGCLYFLLGSCDSRPKAELFVFDCEYLTRMSLPAGAPDKLKDLALCVSNGRLLLFTLHAGVLNVWAMRKSSWTMLRTADLYAAAGFSFFFLTLRTPYWQGSRVLVDGRKSGERQERTWSYDMLTSTWIEIHSLTLEKLGIFEACDYVESLVPPAGEFLLN